MDELKLALGHIRQALVHIAAYGNTSWQAAVDVCPMVDDLQGVQYELEHMIEGDGDVRSDV